MVIFEFRPPSPALREYVRLYKIIGFEFGKAAPLPTKPYWPHPEECLMFYPRDYETLTGLDGQSGERKLRSSLIGQPCTITHRQVGRDFVAFQVVFQPGVLCGLTGMPAGRLTDAYVDAEAVFPAEIRRVNERLGNAADYREMIPVVEDFLGYLIGRARYRHKPIDQIGRYLLEQPRYPSLDWLAREAALSPRQFYRTFTERMGVSPKLYARIVLFDQAVKLKNASPGTDWLSIALHLGYCDYQHLSKDCKEFTGLTPAAFHREENRAPERNFGHKET